MPAISKKETAKVAPAPPSSKMGLPQATVQMQKAPAPASKSASTSAISVVPQTTVPAPSSGEISPVLGAAALVVSLAALAMQVWMLM